MTYKELNGKSIRDGFIEFNNKNPHIYKAFEQQVNLAISKGRKKLSCKLIINWIRWNEFIETTGKNFKLDDAYQSYYARLYVQLNPKHKNLFTFRKLRNEKLPPYMKVDSLGQISFYK